MDVIAYIQEIEAYVCQYFDDWDLDDPIEEGYHADYEEIAGAGDEEIRHFEEHFQIALPSDIKELYRYKNGSGFFCVLPVCIGEREMAFSLMSLQEIEHIKEYFQNRDVFVVENGSWALTAGKSMREIIGQLKKVNIAEETISIKSLLTEDQYADTVAMADKIVECLKK